MKELSIAEKILRRKKDPEFQKQLASEQLDIEGRAEQEISAALKTSKLQQATVLRRKKYFKYGAACAGVLFLVWAYNWLFTLPEAGLNYGICRVFLEQNVRYPSTLRLSEVEELNDFVRLWYTQINAFGEYRYESVKCTYEYVENVGTRLKDITFKSGPFEREVSPEILAAFNKMIPVIVANPPDLTYPQPLPDSLRDLRVDLGNPFL